MGYADQREPRHLWNVAGSPTRAKDAGLPMCFQQPKQQSVHQGSVRQMNITGEIGKLDYGYVIRGKTPSATIFTILNPNPIVLDPYAESEKNVSIDIRIVSGDNVEIEKIEGKAYPKSTESEGK